MLLAHSVTLAEARSYIAALADNARMFDASVEYEQVLLELDAIHGGEVPPTTEVLTDKSDVLYSVAEAAIEELVEHGVDALQVELILALLRTLEPWTVRDVRDERSPAARGADNTAALAPDPAATRWARLALDPGDDHSGAAGAAG